MRNVSSKFPYISKVHKTLLCGIWTGMAGFQFAQLIINYGKILISRRRRGIHIRVDQTHNLFGKEFGNWNYQLKLRFSSGNAYTIQSRVTVCSQIVILAVGRIVHTALKEQKMFVMRCSLVTEFGKSGQHWDLITWSQELVPIERVQVHLSFSFVLMNTRVHTRREFPFPKL